MSHSPTPSRRSQRACHPSPLTAASQGQCSKRGQRFNAGTHDCGCSALACTGAEDKRSGTIQSHRTSFCKGVDELPRSFLCSLAFGKWSARGE